MCADFQCEKPVDVKKSKSYEADVPSDLRKEVESHYRLPLPEDFYHFWRFCEGLDPEQPAGECSRTFLLLLPVEKAVGSWTQDLSSSQKGASPKRCEIREAEGDGVTVPCYTSRGASPRSAL